MNANPESLDGESADRHMDGIAQGAECGRGRSDWEFRRSGWTKRAFVPVLVGLLFAGAMFWAKGRDPFERRWFSVRAEGGAKAECVAVLPKTVERPLPLVVYLHGAGGSVLQSGNELRRMAEMGLAAVALEYNQTNETAYEGQFAALLDYVGRQKWADTNRMAWVGSSLGAERVMGFALRQPERRPRLLVGLGGGEAERLKAEGKRLKSESENGNEIPLTVNRPLTPALSPSDVEREDRRQGAGQFDSGYGAQPMSVLLVHGERDEVFPVSEARRVAGWFRTNGAPVELRVLADQAHDFGPNRLLVFRAVGEYCLTHLNGPEALSQYRSISEWQAQAKPLWLFWLPAFGWLGFRGLRRKVRTTSCFVSFVRLVFKRGAGESCPPPDGKPEPLTRGEKALRWIAAVLAAAALGQTALHLVPPRLAVSERTLAIARKHLVQAKEMKDFDYLSAAPVWPGKRLGILLEHVELANYNRELIDWKTGESVYRDFVLSPEIDAAADGDLAWRRPLWENFYPRIRKEAEPASAAEIVVRFLRERVTVIIPDFKAVGRGTRGGTPRSLAGEDARATREDENRDRGGGDSGGTILEIWRRQITDERGFEAIYVAALRSVGVPAQLSARHGAEFWNGQAWTAAPRPLIGVFAPGK